ncbi:nucleotide sugar dehydrogenase [Wenzhouxiangella sediminis]|uniref:Nucleotide sugar dehydrogenase n=1 Tax=Wenzhouxiangella sediminis TaxID=1792836 RepID=A0A3E1K4B1_9GAMM|nr:nucleotide sugar dehydrogenase [Wenzhouxiangella sediminis]RFF28902.1 nucleotide sugar dehydrogenase [Wenzhouxiangella sediminis]
MPKDLPQTNQARIAVIGLGYVGLPLAVAFGQRQETIGYDIDEQRIQSLQGGSDPTREVSTDELRGASQLRFTADTGSLADCHVYIVAVPTPVDRHKRPDLTHLQDACRTIAPLLEPCNIVIFEATVYPGCTEEVCVPILEALSGLHCAWNQTGNAEDEPVRSRQAEDKPTDKKFFVGYSPERINPGDSAHSLRNVVKITAGSNPEAAEFVDELYKSVVEAGTHPVSSIAVAEAAKVIENTQRDLNIALVNELSLIFNRLNLDTTEILEAAGTKWNFLPFRPGLVGGHCIGVDPYYLTYKAEAVGYHPQVILAGRRINDGMGRHVASELVKLLIRRGISMRGAKVLILGLAFKENCADIRNTRVIDIIEELQSYRLEVDIHDPWITSTAARSELGIEIIEQPERADYDGVIVAVGHDQFREQGIEAIRAYARSDGIVYDVKSVFGRETVDARL